MPEDASVAQLADGLEMTFAPLAAHKQLDFRLDVRPDAPATLVTDRQRVEQILKNLLSNALKFTDHGEVALTVSGTPGGGVAFAVRDSGIGIAADQQEVIFEAFRQADGTTSRRYGGTGLGLSISRDLAHLLGGTHQRAPASRAQGSTFTLVLPQQYVEPQATSRSSRCAGAAGAAPAPASRPPPAPLDRRRPTSRVSPTTAPCRRSTSALRAGDRGRAAVRPHPLRPGARTGLPLPGGPRRRRRLRPGRRSSCPTPSCWTCACRTVPGLTVLQRLKDDAADAPHPGARVSVEDRVEAAHAHGRHRLCASSRPPREELKEVFARLEDKLTQKVKRVLLVEDDDAAARQRGAS